MIDVLFFLVYNGGSEIFVFLVYNGDTENTEISFLCVLRVSCCVFFIYYTNAKYFLLELKAKHKAKMVVGA